MLALKSKELTHLSSNRCLFKKNRHQLLVSKIPIFKIKLTLIIYCGAVLKNQAEPIASYPLAPVHGDHENATPSRCLATLIVPLLSQLSLSLSLATLSPLSSPPTNTGGVAGPAESGATLSHSGVSSGASLPTGSGISQIRRHSSKWRGQRPPMVRELWVASPQCGLGGRPPPRRDGRCSGRPASAA